MDDSEQKPRTPEETRKVNEQCNGAPRYFTYPAPLPCSDEDRQRYAEAGKRVDEILAKQKKRRRRR